MSRTLKCHNLDDAERLINSLNTQIRGLQTQVNQAQTAAHQEAQQIANERVIQLQAETENRFNGIMNDLQLKMDSEHENAKKERIRLEKEHQKALQAQANDFYKQLKSEIVGVRAWTQDQIDVLEESVNRKLGVQQNQIDEVRRQVSDLYENEVNAEKKAASMIADVLDRLNRAKNAQHQKYMPGRLNQIINQVQNLVNSNDPAIARIANARTALNDIWDLEDNIGRAQAKFEALRQIVLVETDAVILEMEKNRNVTVENETGEAIELEINFWTSGLFNKLETEVKALKRELDEKHDSIELNEERLKTIHTRLAAIREEQNKLREITLKKGLESERRIEISEAIVDAMLQEGFRLQGESDDPAFNYMGGEEPTDAREGVFAVMKNANGTEITIIVNTNEDSCTQVVFQRNDDLPHTEAEFRRDLNELKKKIQQGSGVDLGVSMPVARAGDVKQHELLDPKKLAQEGIKKDVKRRLGLN